MGAEVYYHKFSPHTNHFNPLHFFSSTSNTARINTNNSCASFGVNTVGIIRAPRGDGKEAIVLVSPYNSQNMEYNEALSLGLAFSVFSLLSKVTWLAKDIVWLAADSRFGEYNSVSSWLNDYHNPIFSRDSGNLDSISNDCHHWNEIRIQGANSNFFKRAGTMAAALVFKVMEKKEKGDRDCLTMYAEASNGQMPNLDLLNIVHYLAVHRQGLRVKIETMGSLLNSAWVKFTGEILEGVSRLSKSLNPQWKFDVTTADYVEGAATLASSMYYQVIGFLSGKYNGSSEIFLVPLISMYLFSFLCCCSLQALGVPTGSHGAFRDYQIDAVTLEFLPRFYLRNENAQSTFLLRSGRLVILTLISYDLSAIKLYILEL